MSTKNKNLVLLFCSYALLCLLKYPDDVSRYESEYKKKPWGEINFFSQTIIDKL